MTDLCCCTAETITTMQSNFPPVKTKSKTRVEAKQIILSISFHLHQQRAATAKECCCCCGCSVASLVSDSVRPHRRQTTRLPRPWDSPGKNTGVGCHCLLQCIKVKSESEAAQWHSDPQRPQGPQPARLLHPQCCLFSRASACLYMHLIPPWCLGGKRLQNSASLLPYHLGILVQDGWITCEGDVMQKGRHHSPF